MQETLHLPPLAERIASDHYADTRLNSRCFPGMHQEYLCPILESVEWSSVLRSVACGDMQVEIGTSARTHCAFACVEQSPETVSYCIYVLLHFTFVQTVFKYLFCRSVVKCFWVGLKMCCNKYLDAHIQTCPHTVICTFAQTYRNAIWGPAIWNSLPSHVPRVSLLILCAALC